MDGIVTTKKDIENPHIFDDKWIAMILDCEYETELVSDSSLQIISYYCSKYLFADFCNICYNSEINIVMRTKTINNNAIPYGLAHPD